MSEFDPYRVSITGIDGAGKDTVALGALTRLSKDGLRVAKITRPYYRLEDGEIEEMYPRVRQVFDFAHRNADKTRQRGLIGTLNALNTLLQSRVIEPSVANSSFRPDIIASTRDLRIDPAVYSGYYFPDIKISRSIPKLVKRMNAITGIRRDMIVWLEVDPIVALKRINSRIEQESQDRQDGTGKTKVAREKWRHMHEEPDSLSELASKYEEAISSVVELQPQTEVVRIDTTYLSQDAVSQLVYQSIGGEIAVRNRVQELGSALVAVA